MGIQSVMLCIQPFELKVRAEKRLSQETCSPRL
jgi:hypothetical protein